MFKKTRLILTAWYLAIIMGVSLFFSLFIYTNVNAEYRKLEKLEEAVQERQAQGLHVPRPLLHSQIDNELIQEARARLITSLSMVNLFILVISAISGYFLAGRTLRPIKHMVEELNQFISDASHELRTPLTVLRAEIEVYLLTKSPTAAQSKKLVESNLEEVLHLQSLSDNLLRFTEFERTRLHASFISVSLHDTICEAIKKVQKLANKKEIIITYTGKNVMVNGNKDRLLELFIILLDNAIKYSNSKAAITVSSICKAHTVTVTVSDTGIGIDKIDLPHVFDRFYRADKSRSKKVEGFGLGLSIAKKIADAHNGSISVRSKVNEGTVFVLRLPRLYTNSI